MEYRNVIGGESGFVCEVLHPFFGWIPFYATPDDPEEHGRELYERILAEYIETPE